MFRKWIGSVVEFAAALGFVYAAGQAFNLGHSVAYVLMGAVAVLVFIQSVLPKL